MNTYAKEQRQLAFAAARAAIAIARTKARRDRAEWVAIVRFWRTHAAFYLPL